MAIDPTVQAISTGALSSQLQPRQQSTIVTIMSLYEVMITISAN